MLKSHIKVRLVKVEEEMSVYTRKFYSSYTRSNSKDRIDRIKRNGGLQLSSRFVFTNTLVLLLSKGDKRNIDNDILISSQITPLGSWSKSQKVNHMDYTYLI